MPRAKINIETLKHANGKIAVKQHPRHGWEITFNPDTDMFCAHDADGQIVQQRGLLNQLAAWCKRNAK